MLYHTLIYPRECGEDKLEGQKKQLILDGCRQENEKMRREMVLKRQGGHVENVLIWL